MKVITVFNNKGGVGKTTFLCNLAAYFSKLGKRVLVVDADPQCNATQYFFSDNRVSQLYSKASRKTIDVFFDPLRKGKGYLSEGFKAESSNRFNVSVVPGDPRLALSEDLLSSDWKSGISGDPRGLQTSFVFKDLVQRCGVFDYVFFDLGPSLGAINRAALISSDYFVVPMSSDIFSVMAISNISISLKKWKGSMQKGLTEYENEEGEPFLVNNKRVTWNLQFAGYITQQYTSKSVAGIKQPVKAYENVIQKAPKQIKNLLIDEFTENLPIGTKYQLGEIQNLHSIVPLSQLAHSPIFALKAKDGVVGAHFSKVKDAEKLFDSISRILLNNIGDSI